PTPRRWSATRWTAIRNSSPSTPTIRWLRECAPSLPPGARRSRGGEVASSTRRPPIGRICGVIRRGRTRPMRIGVWRFLPPPSSPPRCWAPTPYAVPPRRREEFVYLGRRFPVFAVPVLGSAPPPPPPVFFLAPPPPEFVVLAPHRRPWHFSCCRCRSTG